MKQVIVPIATAVALALGGCQSQYIRPQAPVLQDAALETTVWLDCLDGVLANQTFAIEVSTGQVKRTVDVPEDFDAPEELASYVESAVSRLSDTRISLVDAHDSTLSPVSSTGLTESNAVARHIYITRGKKMSKLPALVINGVLDGFSEIRKSDLNLDVLGIGAGLHIKAYEFRVNLKAFNSATRTVVGSPMPVKMLVVLHQLGGSLWVTAGNDVITARANFSSRMSTADTLQMAFDIAVTRVLVLALDLDAGHCDLGSQAVVAKLPAPVAMSMVRTNDDVCVQYRPVRQLLEPILVWNLRKVNRIVVDSIKVPVPPVRGGNTEFVCLPLEAWGPIPPSSHQIEVIIYDKNQPVSSKSLEL